ncbi:MAG TPA: tRNA (adenine-N1)-methyltransferase [Anaerolineales bacterium]|nr:tRNA (adenine-N1)-methyltransferase [Anaerolineales bacterium]
MDFVTVQFPHLKGVRTQKNGVRRGCTPPADTIPDHTLAQAGQIALLVGHSHKYYLLRLNSGDRLQTHRGEIYHDDLIGKSWGSIVKSHINRTFYLLEPTVADLINELPRQTQIMYPKDIGFILVTMGIGPGRQVLEAGTGSGGLTAALAHAVGPTGHVYSYEQNSETQQIAHKNLSHLGFGKRVTFRVRDIAEGFDEKNIDALILDLPNPYDYLPQVRATLKLGGMFGTLLPTTNQVQLLLKSLKTQNFAFIEVCEILLRYFKDDHSRFRPVDRMVAHTGFLIFARPVGEITMPEE